MSSVTCAVTIFMKPIMGRGMPCEERCTFGSHGCMLMCHIFTEIKTSKHVVLLSVLCKHTKNSASLCVVAMRNSLMLPKCCLNSVPPTTSIKSTNRGGRRGILITLCAQKDVIYLLLVNVFQVILMLQCHLMECLYIQYIVSTETDK